MTDEVQGRSGEFETVTGPPFRRPERVGMISPVPPACLPGSVLAERGPHAPPHGAGGHGIAGSFPALQRRRSVGAAREFRSALETGEMGTARRLPPVPPRADPGRFSPEGSMPALPVSPAGAVPAAPRACREQAGSDDGLEDDLLVTVAGYGERRRGDRRRTCRRHPRGRDGRRPSRGDCRSGEVRQVDRDRDAGSGR